VGMSCKNRLNSWLQQTSERRLQVGLGHSDNVDQQRWRRRCALAMLQGTHWKIGNIETECIVAASTNTTGLGTPQV